MPRFFNETLKNVKKRKLDKKRLRSETSWQKNQIVRPLSVRLSVQRNSELWSLQSHAMFCIHSRRLIELLVSLSKKGHTSIDVYDSQHSISGQVEKTRDCYLIFIQVNHQSRAHLFCEISFLLLRLG